MNRSHIDHIATESSRTPNNSRDTCNDDNCKEDSLTKKRDNTNQWEYYATDTQISRIVGLNGDLFFRQIQVQVARIWLANMSTYVRCGLCHA